jgi:hypothetical protein
MPPSNVSRHDIAPLTQSILVEINIGVQIELPIEIRICQYHGYNSFWVAIPDLISSVHLCRYTLVNRVCKTCLQTLPRDICKLRQVNNCMYLIMRSKRCRCAQLSAQICPDLKESIYIGCRYLCSTV